MFGFLLVFLQGGDVPGIQNEWFFANGVGADTEGEPDMRIVQVIGGADGNVIDLAVFAAKFFQMPIESLELERGTVTALVGPNGSGKSTLLRVLAFVEQPRTGTLSLDGQPVVSRTDRRRARRLVTLVEQRPLLFPGTVQHNLLYALSLHGFSAADAPYHAHSSLDRLGVRELGDRPARDLSEGDTQRVALARAVALKPAVLLLDEPVAGADRAAVTQLYQVLEEERDRGPALCFASHQLEDAYRWSERLIALADGRSSPVSPENLFRTMIPEGTGARTVRVGPLELEVVTDKSGLATLAIPAADIIVSLQPLLSSARNQFTGQVTKISDDGRGGVTLTVDVGLDLAVRITRHALEELSIQLGARVVLSLKAMAVQVF